MSASDSGYSATCTLPPSIGVAMDTFSVPINEHNEHMFEQVNQKVSNIEDVYLREKTIKFLYNLQLATNVAKIDFDLPRIVCDIRHDEAYLEWIFLRFTVGFNLSKDGSEDGWFLISDESLNIDEHGTHLFVIPQIVSFISRFGHE